MDVKAVGSAYQKPEPAPAGGAEQTKPGESSEINKLNAEIEQAEIEMKETLKEVRKAASQSTGGASEKAQMLQNKIQMQQQQILTKQMQVKEMESPEKPASKQKSAPSSARPKVDQFVTMKDESKAPDNVYRVENQDGGRKIAFHRPAKEANEEQNPPEVQQ